jgi:signal transduction histidine kinase
VRVPERVDAAVDGARLRQALGNLVDNALVHGGGDVSLSMKRVNGTVEVHVEDQGAGFPTEFIANAFERFTRGDAARSRGGSGLGLAIVDAIARGHGGTAHARNTDPGSDVWLELPAQPLSRIASGNAAHNPKNSTNAAAPAANAAVSE